MIVTIRHLREAGMCSREPRKWFAKQGLSWTEFVTNGLPEEVLIATGDPLAMKVVEIARVEIACKHGTLPGKYCMKCAAYILDDM
jgi:hypothetical protein